MPNLLAFSLEATCRWRGVGSRNGRCVRDIPTLSAASWTFACAVAQVDLHVSRPYLVALERPDGASQTIPWLSPYYG
jgi:hypothetical protein